MSVPSPALFANYSCYVQLGALLKTNIFLHIALKEYVVFCVMWLFATLPGGPTAMGERYGRVFDSVEPGVSVPLLLRSFCAIQELGFFYIVWSTDFDAALAYVAFCHTCEIHFRLTRLFPVSLQYRVSRQKGVRVT